MYIHMYVLVHIMYANPNPNPDFLGAVKGRSFLRAARRRILWRSLAWLHIRISYESCKVSLLVHVQSIHFTFKIMEEKTFNIIIRYFKYHMYHRWEYER